MLDFEQMAGRGGRDGHTKCLVLLLAESWIFKDRDTELKNSNGTFISRALKTDDDVFNYAKSERCRRLILAELNDDTLEDSE